MQSLFILSLFGVIYTTIAVITTMLSTSAMQLKGQRIESVKQMFLDAEVAVNEGYLGINVDFSALGFFIPSAAVNRIDSAALNPGNRVDKLLSEYMSWTSDQLLMDPWNSNIFVGMTLEDITIYADNDNPTVGVNNSVVAPVAAIMFVSAGPDKIFSAASPNAQSTIGISNYDDMRRYTIDPLDSFQEDNIVHVFTTYSAMNAMWSHIQEVHEKMMAVVGDNYKQQYEAFSPTIQTEFYDVVNFYDNNFNWIGDVGLPGSGCPATPLIHAWKDPDCDIQEVIDNGIANGDLTGLSGFPEFTNDKVALGIENEEERLLQDLTPSVILTPDSSNEGLNDILDFRLEVDAGKDWSIVYEKRLAGSDILSGL